MKINRESFLQKLLLVEPGISTKETIQQSSCVVFLKGRLYTLSQETACSIPSELPSDWEFAIRAEKLIALLKSMKDEEIELNYSKTLNIKGQGKARLNTEERILLPVSEVELPKKDDWQELHEDFAEAVDLVCKCTKRRSEFQKECIHITKSWLESSDNMKMIRYSVPTFIRKSVLVRGESIKVIVQLGMTKAAETSNWLHFKNPTGLRLSVRQFGLEEYPRLEDFLKMRGKRVTFPKGLVDAATRAAIFCEDGNSLKVSISEERLLVEGRSVQGEYLESRKVKYVGAPLAFWIPAKLISELVKEHSNAEVTDYTIRVDGGKYVYCASLMKEDSNER